jgi:hypothetical protein
MRAEVFAPTRWRFCVFGSNGTENGLRLSSFLDTDAAVIVNNWVYPRFLLEDLLW